MPWRLRKVHAWIPTCAGMTMKHHVSFVMGLVFVITSLCGLRTTHAQTSDDQTALLIERLRQQQQITQLESLAQSQSLSDATLRQYAGLCAQLLLARSESDGIAILKIADKLQALPTDHASAALWAMLATEVQLYDIWATGFIDPAVIVSMGYPTQAQLHDVEAFTRRYQTRLTQAYQQLQDYPTGIASLMRQRCGFLLAQINYLLTCTEARLDRMTLLQQAHEVLQPLLNTTRDDWKMMHRARWLDVSILLAMGQVDAARDAAPAMEVDPSSMLIRARLLAAMSDVEGSYQLLTKLESQVDPNDVTMQLSVADNQHQLMFPRQEYARAFGMYIRLLGHEPSSILRDAIATRWQMKQVLGTSLKILPDALLFTIARQMFEVVKAEQDDKQHSALTLAATSLILLRDRQSVMQGALADRVQLLWAILKPAYEPDEPQKVIESLSMLTHLVQTSDDDALVYDALTAAVQLTEPLFKSTDPSLRARAINAYQPLARVLFGRFNTSELADNSRLFDVVAVRLPAREYALALQRLADLPASHQQYWLSLRYTLGIYRQLIGHPDWPDARVTAAIAPIRDQAVSMTTQAYHNQLQTIEQVAVEASGMLWQLAAKQNQWQSAADQLQWIASANSLPARDRQIWLSRRLVSLQRAGQFKAAGQLSTELLDQFGKPVFGVVMQTLSAMDAMLDTQRLARMHDEKLELNAQQLASLMQTSQSVVRWASEHVADEHQLLLGKIIWAKCLCDAGQMRDAVSLLSPLLEQFVSEPALWLTLAECHFQLKIPANYQQAARLYHKVISRSLPDADGKFPSRYWLAWTRYLQICDLTNQHVDVIVSRIASLKAEDATLGGEPYASLLNALSARHAENATPVK